MKKTLHLNGKGVVVDLPGDTPLLWAIREGAGLTGTKFGCGRGLCGACTVLLDGEPVRSCSLALEGVGAGRVTTVEGLGASGEKLRAAWLAEQVPQCGYCQSGMLVAAAALLKTTPQPTPEQIGASITNLCRCGTYPRVRRAILRAAGAK